MRQEIGHQNELSLFGPIEASAEMRFWVFHQKNPHVYQALRDMALEVKAAGHERYSIRTLWEVLRWKGSIKVQDPNQGAVKLNDHYVPHYARFLEAENPELKDFFEKRRLRA